MSNMSTASRIDELLKQHPDYFNHMSGINKIKKANVYVLHVIVCQIVHVVLRNYL